MSFDLFVNGGLMRGIALHGNLDGAEFLSEDRSALAAAGDIDGDVKTTGGV